MRMGGELIYSNPSDVSRYIEIAYKMLPPPLASIPAKYHAPISLLVHSLSTGYFSSELARLLDLESEAELAFLLGVTHDIHQKLIEDGLATPKTTKKYVAEKLDEIGKGEYFRYIERALDIDACGKGNPIRGMPKELSLLCYIGDMAQGRIEGIELLYWLRSKVKELNPELTVRFYSVMLPQPFARSYIMRRIYQRYIAETKHLALTSPWGLYVITYEDKLSEVLEVSWDDLRIGCDDNTKNLVIADYESIKEAESQGRTIKLGAVKAVGFELRNKLWSRFARMFYCKRLLSDKPIYPTLHKSIEGLFINIEFTDIQFKEIQENEAFYCALCGLPHHMDNSLSVTMYGTGQLGNVKIAGVYVKTEKWNRFLPAHLKVKSDDKQGLWWNRIGMCPICTLDAIGIRHIGFTGKLNAFISVSFAKPIPIELLGAFARMLRDIDIIEKPYEIEPSSPLEGVVVDYSSATIATARAVPEVKMENLFKHRVKIGRRSVEVDGVFIRIGKLIKWGIYPVKYLPSLNTSITDRPIVTPYNFSALDFPVTSREARNILPWVGTLLKVAGSKERSEALWALEFKPNHIPLDLLILDKEKYDSISIILSRMGVGV